MYLCKKEINPEEPCPSGLIVMKDYVYKKNRIKYNKNYFFTAVGRLNKSFLAFLGISMAVVVLTEFTSMP